MPRAQGCAGAAGDLPHCPWPAKGAQSFRVLLTPLTYIHVGQVFTLQTIPPKPDSAPGSTRVAKLAGFSLHAGVAAKAHQRKKIERLCRYIARPAVSEKRLSITPTGKVRYELKTPYRNGTIHVIACVEDPKAIEKILKHLKQKAVSDNTAQPPPSRAPPRMALFEHS